MDEPRIRARVFLSVPEEPTLVGDIFMTAHLMSRDYLVSTDFGLSLRWLENEGLVSKDGAKFCLTAAGVALRDRTLSSSSTDTWDKVTEYFRQRHPNI